MGRNRGKFSFPMPGRRSQKKTDRDDDANSPLSTPSVHDRPPRIEEPSTSKAHRVLGTSDAMYRSTSRQSVPASPGYMSITVSEASYGSQHDDRASNRDHNGYLAQPVISRRPSSNVIGRPYTGEAGRGSDHSVASNRLHPQTSNSTMRSHYDAKASPLAISQQTSDSAVRDMALRRGQPQVVTDYHNGYVASPVSPVIESEAKRKEQRKSKPARLDLSKLFPKPRGGEGSSHSHALLSPTKMVKSPAAMSFNSDYHFPRPMTREPTPNPTVQLKPKKLQRKTSAPPTPTSPMRKVGRDEYDNAKVHIRRPPKGVQHWFDALDEESDDLEKTVPIHAPKPVRPYDHPEVPSRKASLGQLHPESANQQTSRSQHLDPSRRRDTFTHEDLVDVARLTSPSQYSLQSTKTKESALSKSNLQDSSVLSFSSSEDEGDEEPVSSRRVPVRKSLDNYSDAGEIEIGQAHAYELRSQRRPSRQMSMRSSTSAATIEVMYTPEPPFTPLHYPRNSSYSGSRRSSHVRQPSVIHEDDDVRPRTSISHSMSAPYHEDHDVRPRTSMHVPVSPPALSITSTRTSMSEPKPRSDGMQKFMAVTAEEEALLELMRKKRAAMAMGMPQIPQIDYPKEEDEAPLKAPIDHSRGPYRTSGFLAEASPVRAPEHNARRPTAVTPSPLPHQLPPRGRTLKTHYDASVGHNQFRDSSTSDAWSENGSRAASRISIPHQLPTPSAFSPLDPFPPSSPVLAASVTSQTTTEHASPLPSPVTPGLRAYEHDINVKVANSDTSNDLDEVSVLETGVIDVPQQRIKSPNSPNDPSNHRRRRTASSHGADLSFPVPPTHGPADPTPVSEASFCLPTTMEPPLPKIPAKNSKRMSGLTLLTNSSSRSRQSSIHSQASSQSHASSHLNSSSAEKKNARFLSHQSSHGSLSAHSSLSRRKEKERNSISDDVLAAWNSLGGTY
jgi:hypothetical protein